VSINAALRAQVRMRTDSACEYCGVTEINAGGELTIDHYQPQARGGSDSLDNLVYACHRCNQYKADYWAVSSTDPLLWNPCAEPSERHFLELIDGMLYPLTPTGAFTAARLRLNRSPLAAHRLHKRSNAQEQRLLAQYRDVVALLEQVSNQQIALIDENRALLEEQRLLLRLLIEQIG